MPEITLSTRDGARFAFTCATTETLLDAAETAGLYLPAMCHEGTCGACHAHVREGDYTLGTIGEGVLPDRDAGGVLLCRCRPDGDLQLDLPYDQSDIHRHQIPRRTARVEEIAPAGSGAVALKLVLEADDVLGNAADFTPGQYMEVSIPGTTIRRAYSLANLPNWDGQLEFLIRLQPGGAFSSWLAQVAKPGEVLELRGPLGRFILDETSARPRYLIGGGCGFAPVLSMLRHLAAFQNMQPTTLIFGVNREDELFAVEQIEELRSALPMLTVMLCVWHPQPSWQGFVGTAAEALAGLLTQSTTFPDIYVCGPPKLVSTVVDVAHSQGVPANQVFTEQVQPR
ncbi:2Fe-2S iron-sulfur cluster-binding protein [Acidiphilium sp.]|uniref:2Fe-2S iron-sulfur cluster-binding protein n=1 Tax=Acidiphilium sp. TaxID=527 RepID=UPI003CFC2F47